jgi:transcriptional regulator with XRE-family HTH domain
MIKPARRAVVRSGLRAAGNSSPSETPFAQFLRARRSRVQPADVGLPAGGRRRVAGLRREEVASLAGISTDYYGRLEQGKETSPSDQVLRALGRALQLGDDALMYMRNLVHRRDFACEVGPSQQPHFALGSLLDSWSLTAAVVIDPGTTVVRANPLAQALCPCHEVGTSLVGALFLEPELRSFYVNWEQLTTWCVSFIRGTLAQRCDPALLGLVDDLNDRSPWFRQLWGRHDVTEKTPRVVAINHPQLGAVDLNYQQLLVSGTGHWLVTYWVEPGSTVEDGLRLLSAS